MTCNLTYKGPAMFPISRLKNLNFDSRRIGNGVEGNHKLNKNIQPRNIIKYHNEQEHCIWVLFRWRERGGVTTWPPDCLSMYDMQLEMKPHNFNALTAANTIHPAPACPITFFPELILAAASRAMWAIIKTLGMDAASIDSWCGIWTNVSGEHLTRGPWQPETGYMPSTCRAARWSSQWNQIAFVLTQMEIQVTDHE